MNCPKCKAPLERRNVAGETDVEICGSCYGVFYDLKEIAVNLRLERPRASKVRCPKDGAVMRVGTVYGGKLEIEQCPQCGGWWFDAGEIQKLRKISGVDQIIGTPGTAASAAGMIPPIVLSGASTVSVVPGGRRRGSAQKPAPAPPPAKDKPSGSFKKITKVPEPEDGAYLNNPDQALAPSMRHGDAVYQHFQTSRPVVKYVVGEFNWRVSVGDRAKARDFICPPYILSQDISANDYVWSHGEYIEPEEVWRAFKLDGNPPLRHGVNPAQSNPHAEAKSAIGRWFGVFLGAACATFFALALIAQNRVVFQQQYTFQPQAGVDASFVTPEFDLKGHTSNVKIRIETNLSNMWIFFRMALINADTDIALDFDREVSYYFGSSGGESWSEGGRKDTVYLPKVKAGRYYLRIDPQSRGSVRYTLKVMRDVPRMSFLALAVLLLGLPWMWVGWRTLAFEKQRWHESDHPWVEEE